MVETLTESNRGGKGLFGLHALDHSPLREAKAGAWRPGLKQKPLRNAANGSLHGLSVCFPAHSRPPAQCGAARSGPGPSMYHPSREYSTGLPTDQSDGGLASTGAPSSRMALACIRLTKTNQYTSQTPTFLFLFRNHIASTFFSLVGSNWKADGHTHEQILCEVPVCFLKKLTI